MDSELRELERRQRATRAQEDLDRFLVAAARAGAARSIESVLREWIEEGRLHFDVIVKDVETFRGIELTAVHLSAETLSSPELPAQVRELVPVGIAFMWSEDPGVAAELPARFYLRNDKPQPDCVFYRREREQNLARCAVRLGDTVHASVSFASEIIDSGVRIVPFVEPWPDMRFLERADQRHTSGEHAHA